MLDRLVAVGMGRSTARRLLSQAARAKEGPGPGRGRRPKYDEAAQRLLERLWLLVGMPCGTYMRAMCLSSNRRERWGVVTFCWTPVSLFFDYAMSPSSRLRFAMLVPKVSLILSSRYQVMYASSRSMNPLMVTLAKSRPRRGLLLETPEEPLRGRVVRGAALRAHGSGQLVFPADADPSGPPVMAAAVGVDDRMLPVAERGARVAEHPVGQLGVRARADRPGHRHPVVAVDHRRQVDLARGDAELRQVGHPQPVRPLGVEVPVDEVVRRLAADLALVRAVAAGPLCFCSIVC